MQSELSPSISADLSFRNHSETNSDPPSKIDNDFTIIDEKLTQFFVGCNIPFSIVESVQFKEFVNSLNPKYKPPCRKTLSSILLNKLHKKISNEHKDNDQSDGVIVIDGWKNSVSNTKNVVCIIHTANEESFFLNSWDFTSISENTIQLTKVIEEAVNLAKTNYNKNIYAVVSDNAPVMVAMGKAVNLWHAGCSSHNGNLLAKDLIDQKFAESVNTILRTFKAPNLERQVLERGGTKMKLACETRWCSYRDAFQCCLRNLDIMKEILNDKLNNEFPKSKKQDSEKEKISTSYNLLIDDSFMIKLQDFIVLSDPICSLINKCQQSNFTLPNAAEEWLKLNIPTENEETQEIVKKRVHKVLTPILLAANLLHPVYQGKRFLHIEKYRSQALQFIKNKLKETSYHELEAYQNKSGSFGTLFRKENVPPQLFWQMTENSFPNISKLAQKLINIPGSSAQIERLFSNWSYVHFSLRNRLTVDRSKKLIDIYYSLKMNSEKSK
ncbi:GSCOCG00012602001-RA-CDS [Cotesia congregata]|nr:GSCOCG00012602001-RA-CDS [Cotesia congregata]